MRARGITLGFTLVVVVYACGGTTGDDGTAGDHAATGNDAGRSLASAGGEAESLAGVAGTGARTTGGRSSADAGDAGASLVGGASGVGLAGAGTGGSEVGGTPNAGAGGNATGTSGATAAASVGGSATGGGPPGGAGGDGAGGSSAAGMSGAAGGSIDPDASPCDAWLGDGTCNGDEPNEVCLDCEGPGAVSRTCQLPAGTVYVHQAPCASGPCTTEEVPGSGVDCAPGRICAFHRRADGELLSVECLDNPCGSSLVDRDCAAASICPEERRWYVDTLGGRVEVDCYAWPPECPTTRPRAGDPCPLDWDSCVYQDCEGAGLLLAECVDGLWTTHAEACRAADCRDAGTCEAGDACLVLVGPGPVPGNTTYSCEPVAGEPGLVAQRMLLCGQGTAMVSIYGGMLSTNCTCNAEGGC